MSIPYLPWEPFVTEAEWRRDPEAAMRTADTFGSVLICDDRYKPRMRIGRAFQRDDCEVRTMGKAIAKCEEG